MKSVHQISLIVLIGICLVAGATGRATILTWDTNPGSPGAQDGGGSWSAATTNTNWWNGATNVAWNNASNDIAVLGVNSAANATVTLTNSVTIGGLVYSNAGAGLYTIGVANGAALAFGGSAPCIQLSGPGGLHAVSPALIAPGGLSILAASGSATSGIMLRASAAANNIAGSLFLGTPGNAAYNNATALYVDFNNGSVANVLNTTTNVTVYSNASVRISGQNGSAYNLAFPKKFTLSGDGQTGTRGAWLITGDSGGTYNASVELAGGATLMTTVGSGGSPTFTLNGTLSGTGDLRLVNDNAFTSKPTLVLTSGPGSYDGQQTLIGGNLTVRLQNGNDRLPTSTALTLGITNAPAGATWNGSGRLVLGNSSAAANQAFTGLNCDGGVSGSAVLGGNSTSNSVLSVSNAADCLFAGSLGGSVSPDNQLGLVKSGAGRLRLTGTNVCAGGYTLLGGTLEFGDGLSDKPLSGAITNHGALVFNVASNQTYAETISGTGSFTKLGGGRLVLSGTNRCSGGFVVSNGTLGGTGFIAGPVVIAPGSTLAPGASIGLLTISNTLTLAGTTVMQLDKLTPTNDTVRGLSSVLYGGTLVLSNVAGNYAVGDAFKLFDAANYSGGFTNLIPALPGPSRAWDTSTLTVDGTLRITTNSTPNHAPTWSADPILKPDAATNVAYNATLAGSATDEDVGDTLTFSKAGGPAWLAVGADGTLSGTPGAGDLGTNSFTVRATDSGGSSNNATLLILVMADPNAPVQLLSPDGRLALTFAVDDFDGSVRCPLYSMSCTGQTVITTSKLGLTFGGGAWRDNVTVTVRATSSNDSTWSPVWGERSLVRDCYNELVVTLQETASPNRIVQVTFRAYNEGMAFCYTIPAQAGLTTASALTEQSEFRFTANHTAWSVTSAQGGYATSTVDNLSNGNERPLTVQMSTNLFLSLGEARLVDYARMKFNQASAANSLVSALASSVTSTLPMRSPWRFVMVADSPAQLLQNNDFVLNLNDACALTNTAWIKPGKVIREVTLITTGGVACVDYAVKHNLQYIEFDAGWYGPENTTASATNVNVDPSRSPGPLDLQYVINYANSNNVGVILYVNKLALANQIDILPALYRSWGVKGMKFGFVNVGSQADTKWLHDSIRKCATNEILVDVHDEYRMTGWSRTYPNFLTAEGISGDETTPSASQDITLLFTRMIAGPADHTMCFYDTRVTNNWNHAYQLAKAVCFFSPWQFIHWYDRPTNSPNYVAGGNAMITEDPALEFHDHMPTVWDDTKVIHGSMGQYAVIARRSGEDWFIGAMNAGTTRTLTVPLDFLAPGRRYIAHSFSHDPTLTTRTRVRVERTEVTASDVLSLSLAASDGKAWRITPVEPPAFAGIARQGDGSMSLTATGKVMQPWSCWAGTNLLQPSASWSLLSTGLFSNGPAQWLDTTAPNHTKRFYRLTSP